MNNSVTTEKISKADMVYMSIDKTNSSNVYLSMNGYFREKSKSLFSHKVSFRSQLKHINYVVHPLF